MMMMMLMMIMMMYMTIVAGDCVGIMGIIVIEMGKIEIKRCEDNTGGKVATYIPQLARSLLITAL